MDGTDQGFACRLGMFLFLYPGSKFTSPCPKETGNLPPARESPNCPWRRDGCHLLCPSAPGDAAALTPGLSLLPTSLESAPCLSIFWFTPCFLCGQARNISERLAGRKREDKREELRLFRRRLSIRAQAPLLSLSRVFPG
jgi:hypothetical protein